MADDADVTILAPLDAAIIELLKADRDDDEPRALAAITAIAATWIQMDQAEQESKLHYFRADRPYGASLRAALEFAATKYDLGQAGTTYAELKGRPWP